MRLLPTIASGTGGPLTVADLCDIYEDHTRTSKMKRGRARSPKTIEGYLSGLDFIRITLVYRAGDRRLDRIDAMPGDSIRIDEEHGLTTADLFRFIDERTTTNLRTREANERAAQKYADRIVRRDEAIASGRPGRRPYIPEPPVMKEEDASAGTVKEACRMLRAVIAHAVSRELMTYDPWTDHVEAAVPTAETPYFTTRVVMSDEQILRLAEGMSRFERATTGGEMINGHRYTGLVAFLGMDAPRQAEAFAVRLSSFNLDVHRPRVTVYEGVSFVSKARLG